MIGYVTLGTKDIAIARDYYDALLGSIGAKRLMQFDDEADAFRNINTLEELRRE